MQQRFNVARIGWLGCVSCCVLQVQPVNCQHRHSRQQAQAQCPYNVNTARHLDYDLAVLHTVCLLPVR